MICTLPRTFSYPSSNMPKRRISQSEPTTSKRVRESDGFTPIKIATEQAAAKADSNAPLSQLIALISGETPPSTFKSRSVLYWMRMSDLRLRDNKALSRASQKAKEDKLPLIALFIISPQDYIAHDRGARKIDFLLRNLAALKESFSELNIPFHTASITPRKSIPSFVLSFCEKYGAGYLCLCSTEGNPSQFRARPMHRRTWCAHDEAEQCICGLFSLPKKLVGDSEC